MDKNKWYAKWNPKKNPAHNFNDELALINFIAMVYEEKKCIAPDGKTVKALKVNRTTSKKNKRDHKKKKIKFDEEDRYGHEEEKEVEEIIVKSPRVQKQALERFWKPPKNKSIILLEYIQLVYIPKIFKTRLFEYSSIPPYFT